MDLGEHVGAILAEPYRSIPTLEVHSDFREPSGQSERHVDSENDGHDPDGSSHYRIQGPSKYWCMECSTKFPNSEELYGHAQHKPCECSCGKRFSRVDSLSRHCAPFREDKKKYPCNFCKRHRGKQSFTRRDHLIQHLEVYHAFDQKTIEKNCPGLNRTYYNSFSGKVCPHIGCEFYRGDEFKQLRWYEKQSQRPFKKWSTYYKHMRNVHHETAFPCPVDGCERVDARGYTTKIGLTKHLSAKHSGVPLESLDLRPKLAQFMW
ncbi:hypothetical protein F4821DRAFT_279655 [Hypoxylon rubiginosum]|uniref:Uncharacterized protein n=1 Tax=Hypoxylon rubiginosum TaxID=110542 RepID=A0ACC0CXB6_9PEZI|nr:hypothetical protein F4821DRAFT_279655 [Hypoxylon rubiginosum]